MILGSSAVLVFRMGCINNMLSVGIGAKMGHRTNKWSDERLQTFNTAQKYHLLNSFGMICSAFVTQHHLPLAICFLLGTILFVFPLYHKVSYNQTTSLQKLNPVGGMAMMIGWLAMAFCI